MAFEYIKDVDETFIIYLYSCVKIDWFIEAQSFQKS